MTTLISRGWLLAAVLLAVLPAASTAGRNQPGPAPTSMQFRAEQIASDFGIGYAVALGDVNGDGFTDIIAINATDLVWFEAPKGGGTPPPAGSAPAWQKHLMLSGVTPRDNVCIAPHDIDRDGRLDIALGAGWQPTNTTGGGSLHWVRQNAPGAEPAWELFSIGEEPTLHRIRWGDVDGDGTLELIVQPLHGRETKAPDWLGKGARTLVFRPPADPRRETWPVEVADDTLHIVHNFLPTNMDGDARQEILTASREGVNVLKRGADGKWTRTLLGEGAPGEIKMGKVGGRRMLATVEPWHGKSIVTYVEGPGLWSRTTIESEIAGGHALGWADFDGDGNDDLAVGWRDGKPGVAIYAVDRDGARRLKATIDDGGMATEDLVIADLNGDKKPDIVASGRATHNVKIYWNESAAPK